MNSSIFYELKLNPGVKLIKFYGHSIMQSDLIEKIAVAENIDLSYSAIKLQRTDGHEIEPNELIVAFTKVIVLRVACKNPKKAPKIQRQQLLSNQQKNSVVKDFKTFNETGENELSTHMTTPYDNVMKGLERKVNSKFQCYKCGAIGQHNYQNCPGFKDAFGNYVDRRTFLTGAGLMRTQLVEVPPMTPNSILLDDGKYYNKKIAPTESIRPNIPAKKIEISQNLKCPLCFAMFLDPQKTPCCSTTYCRICIVEKLYDPDICGDRLCPKCKEPIAQSADLSPDLEMMEAVKNFKNISLTQNKPCKDLNISVESVSTSVENSEAKTCPSKEFKEPYAINKRFNKYPKKSKQEVKNEMDFLTQLPQQEIVARMKMAQEYILSKPELLQQVKECKNDMNLLVDLMAKYFNNPDVRQDPFLNSIFDPNQSFSTQKEQCAQPIDCKATVMDHKRPKFAEYMSKKSNQSRNLPFRSPKSLKRKSSDRDNNINTKRYRPSTCFPEIQKDQLPRTSKEASTVKSSINLRKPSPKSRRSSVYINRSQNIDSENDTFKDDSNVDYIPDLPTIFEEDLDRRRGRKRSFITRTSSKSPKSKRRRSFSGKDRKRKRSLSKSSNRSPRRKKTRRSRSGSLSDFPKRSNSGIPPLAITIKTGDPRSSSPENKRKVSCFKNSNKFKRRSSSSEHRRSSQRHLPTHQNYRLSRKNLNSYTRMNSPRPRSPERKDSRRFRNLRSPVQRRYGDVKSYRYSNQSNRSSSENTRSHKRHKFYLKRSSSEISKKPQIKSYRKNHSSNVSNSKSHRNKSCRHYKRSSSKCSQRNSSRDTKSEIKTYQRSHSSNDSNSKSHRKKHCKYYKRSSSKCSQKNSSCDIQNPHKKPRKVFLYNDNFFEFGKMILSQHKSNEFVDLAQIKLSQIIKKNNSIDNRTIE